ncbi:RNA polymerase sigma-70 factor [Pedobacter psychrodurus]|uniref:RNA polymerase sigma-70 factor n=1 Tax=Pedobacter psychrodurus TaxID=2530456 RepID=A0A4R0Q9T4_9SPHI|nr:RNA polymerase sigma-70 factor [Pedobacter psychrodurus]TCD28674.1 RNA polymerase sigma-70 factor [Pedobacter psychrodurus]
MNINQTGDFELLKQLANDDEKAFDQLFVSYYPGLIRFCKSLLNSSNGDAEDLVQDVFFKLWESRKSLSVHTALNSFLYTSVKNKVNDHFRKKKTKAFVPIDSIEERSTDSFYAPDQQLMYKELDWDIHQMITLLPDRTELVFRMNRHDHLSYEEISNILGISIHSVKTHMYRAIKFLKENFRYYNSPS